MENWTRAQKAQRMIEQMVNRLVLESVMSPIGRRLEYTITELPNGDFQMDVVILSSDGHRMPMLPLLFH